MPSDPIVEEIHKIREALAEASGNDLKKIAQAANARQRASGREAIRLSPRPPKPAKKAS